MRAATVNHLKERKLVSIGDLAGVDFSSSALGVSTRRASNMRNFIKNDGVNRKRHGWRDEFIIPGADGYPVGGLYPFTEDGVPVVIATVGTCVFRAEKSGGRWTVTRLNDSAHCAGYRVSGTFSNQKTSGFYRGGQLYIKAAGFYAVYGKFGGHWELRDVRKIAYAPVTTVTAGDVVDTLEEVNALTRARRNAFYSESGETGVKLDGKIKYGKIAGGTRLDWVSPVKIEVKESSRDMNGVYINVLKQRRVVENADQEYVDPDERYTATLYRIEKIRDLLPDGSVPGRMDLYVGTDDRYLGIVNHDHPESADNDVIIDYGSTDVDVYLQQNEEVLLSFGGLAAIHEAEATFFADGEVTHESTEPDGTEVEVTQGEEIINCTFGVTFGVTSNEPRLFLSGNVRQKNMEYYSAEDDFTYFPDINYKGVGSTYSAIVGFQQLTDNTLAVFKEKSEQDVTIHYQTGQSVTEYDENGTAIGQRDDFPTFPGTVGETIASREASINFLGDNLILSENGVFGIVMRENISIIERYAQERSRLINTDLCKRNLKHAVAIASGNRYYLSVDSVCYVADARYKTYAEGTPDNTYSYEWWFWDHVDARVFAEIGGGVWFGTVNGRVCRFHEGYADEVMTELVTGQFTYSAETGRFTLSPTAKRALTDGGRLECDSGTFFIRDVEEVGDGVTLSVSETADGEAAVIPFPTFVRIWERFPVVAEWYTPLLDFGTNMYAKTMLRFSVTTQAVTGGHLTVGYEVQSGVRDVITASREVAGVGRFSFDSFDFSDFTFSTGFQTSFTVPCNVRNFMYIVFKIASEDDADCAFEELSVQYKINKLVRGVC